MKPIVLKGHERAINFIKYNREGDLLFSCSKADNICAWFTDNGERLGTFDGHNGSIWYLDIDYDSKRMLSASADMTVKLWEVETGKELFSFEHPAPVRSVVFSHGEQQFLSCSDVKMGQKATLRIFDLAENIEDQQSKAISTIVVDIPISKAYWGPSNSTIITCHENGLIQCWDVETSKVIQKSAEHTDNVKQLQFDADYITMLSASRDQTAKLFDLKELKCIKSYKCNRPVNAAAMSPVYDHIVLGGGQEAKDVTTTGSRAGKFDAIFFNKIFEDELGSVKGHFGPIHTLQFSPDGKQYSSGSEDGFIRMHTFDESYSLQANKFVN